MRPLFLSFPESLRPAAIELAEKLEAAGLPIWCQAQRALAGSVHSVEQLREVMVTAGGLLVLFDVGGLGRWQAAELRWAREIQMGNPHFAIIALAAPPLSAEDRPDELDDEPFTHLPETLDDETAAQTAKRLLDIQAQRIDRLSGRFQTLERPTDATRFIPRLRAISREDIITSDAPFEPIGPVEVEPDPDSPFLGKVGADRLLLLVIHGGRHVPEAYMPSGWKSRRNIERHYEIEKDWGANQLAYALAAKLGLGRFHKVNTARVLMDFGRFPGTTAHHAGHLNRFAISGAFSESLEHAQKRALLKDHYDRISDYLEPRVPGRTVLLTLHTYDALNYPSRTRRPPISLIHTPTGYHLDTEMPFGVFDPLYPDVLAESTADRRLLARLALHFESTPPEEYKRFLGKAWDGWFYRVAFNHPYTLPDGSLEVRAQVWHFFNWLRQAYDAEHPETVGRAAHALVWKMLLDTNLRKADTVALRSFIHMFRDPPEGALMLYEEGKEPVRCAAEDVMAAYRSIAAFVKTDDRDFVRRYRRSEDRLSALSLEVRKDLLWRFQEPPWEGADRPVARTDPEAPRFASINFIAHTLAGGIARFFEEDLAEP